MIADYAVLTRLSAEFGKIHGVYYLLATAYAPGIKVSDEELATLAMERDKFH